MCCVMICWFKYPFIRLLIPFATGIWLAFFKGNVCVSENVVVYLLIILLVLLTSLILSSFFIKNYRYRYVFSILLNIFLLLSGFLYVRILDYSLKVNDLSNIEFTPKHYVARLCECPAEKDNSVKVMMDLLEIEDESSQKHKFESKIIAYFEKDASSMSLEYGDCIIFLTNP